ncbi:uncharacterized protein LOC122045013 isoform X1 [Zingiber officinale]|uniref:SANT domain-containing protein n=1 Tax=Zingiber officinale TaxID=94328 RepID=A0A8J5H849_ZINOF|nr:uncharacterized protein LOC122045013 isoform X1 [Zingiber officinale]XP_042460989.1 uncharacterized protein LOC122045013 isoform X1 [Zingiber officinale]KAG6523146.1 hypothetical protein ZIOFF_012999 [Zingiber officinale]
MPPEPLPWERKEYTFKDHRKHERGDALGGAGGGSAFSVRWRELHQVPRDFSRASPRRPLTGQYQQGGSFHQVYPEDFVGHGSTPSHSDRIWSEDDSFRPSSARYFSDYRSSRENRGSCRRSPYWDVGEFPRQQHHQETHAPPQRPVSAPISSTSQTSSNRNYDKIECMDDDLGTLNSQAWKKWNRPASTTTGRSESEDGGTEVGLPLEKETSVVCLASDESAPKKPRLGWGQGLAKYEKQKVEGSTEPSVGAMSGCLSPSTPSSATCSSSPGTEDKLCSRAGDDDNGDLPESTFPSFYEEIRANLDNLEVNPISSLDSLLVDLFQSEDAFGNDSSLMRHSAMNKFSELKSQVSNAYEKIENKIDLLEKELKAITCDSKTDARQGALKSADDYASALSRSLGGLSNGCKDFKDQQVKCIEESSLNDDELKPSGGLDEHDNVVEETVSPPLEEELPVCGMEKMMTTLSSIEHETQKLSKAESTSFVNSSVRAASHGMTQMKTDSNLANSIMDSNRNTSRLSWEVFSTKFSKDLPSADDQGFVNFTSCHQRELKVKQKLAITKRQQKFRERVLTLKFRALHRLWREDLRLLSIKRLRTKSSKRTELSNRCSQHGSQKLCSSIQLQSALPGNSTLVPTAEIMNFTSKLLLDSQIKICRSNLKMPVMLLNEPSRKHCKFVADNGLIEDPLTSEIERGMINPWLHDEKEVFKKMLAKYGKDFTKISSFLDHKTTADCIEFYYKSHKSESFKDVKKSLDLRKQQQSLQTSAYLVASGKNWNSKTSVASLDLLGAASVMALREQYTARLKKYVRSSLNEDGANEHTSAREIEFMAADALAGICGTVSSEAISSYDTGSIDPAKNTKDEDDSCSDEVFGELDSADWTDEEKSMFMQALRMYGKDFAGISSYMRTRSREQCKIFFSKARKCLSLDMLRQGCVDEITPISLTNGGRSDTDDACVVEMDSAICSTQSCSKIDDNASQPLVGTRYEKIDNPASTNFRVKTDYEVNDHSASTDFQVKTERSNELVDNVPIKPCLEDCQDEVDRQAAIVHDVKPAGSGDNLQSYVPPKGSIITASGCESVQLCEDAESADRETKVEGIDTVISLPEPVVLIRKSEQVEECIGVSNQQTASLVTGAGIDGCFSSGGMEKELDSKPPLDAEVGLSNAKFINSNFTADGNDPVWFPKASVQSALPVVSAPMANGCHHLTDSDTRGQIQVDAHPSAAKKLQTTLKQENGQSTSLDSFLSDPADICFGGSPRILYETTINLEEYGNNKHKNLIKRDLCPQYMLRNLPFSQVDRDVNILRGYPLQSAKQEANGETTIHAGMKLSRLRMEAVTNGASQSNHLFLPDKHWDKGNVSTLHSVPAPFHPVRSEHQSDADLRTCSEKAGEVEEPKPGDVKLFGKILSMTTSSLQKSPSPSPSRESDRQPWFPKMDGALNSACQVNLETTCGFWDSKRIQTDFSSMPDTASMLLEFKGSPTIASHNPAKDGSPGCDNVVTGAMSDYLQSHMQTLPSNMKHIENVPGLQKRTSIETIPGFQQQMRVLPLGTNMMGGGMLVGGGAVSDPITALKMHFAARANLYSSDTEPWRGDTGSR